MSDVRMKHSERGEDDLRAKGGHVTTGKAAAEEMAEMEAEGHKGRHRFAKGGKVPKIKINIHGGPHLHVHGGGIPGMPMAPQGPKPGPSSPMAGSLPQTMAPPPGPPMMRRGGRTKSDYGPSDVPTTDISNYKAAKNQGGPVKAGANTGVSRKIEYEKLKGKD
jgi:hypothetical protein